jgi:hypothetical protein
VHWLIGVGVFAEVEAYLGSRLSSQPCSSLPCSAVFVNTGRRRLARIANGGSALLSSAVEYLTGKGLGKGSRLLLTFKIDPADICARNLPETDNLKFHMIEPRSHLAQLMGQVSGLDRYFDDVNH